MLESKDIKDRSDVTKIDDVKEKAILRMNRRTFVKMAGAAVGALALGRFAFHPAFAAQGTPLPASAIPQFVDQLPIPHIIDVRNATNPSITLNMTEFQSPVLSTGTPGVGQTHVWGYKAAGQTATTYIGPVILAGRNNPVQMTYVNNLGDTNTTQIKAWKESTDQTLHWADPHDDMAQMLRTNYAGPIPAVAHLHGGEVPPDLDGGPDAWFLSNPAGWSPPPGGWTDYTPKGPSYYTRNSTDSSYTAVYRYPNTQEGAIWFHDHALGITRLNVYAGLAGAYLIEDPGNMRTDLPELIPLAIQDRMFDTTGELFFPADMAAGLLWIPNYDHPFWVPEFVGDTIVVNGKTWPNLNVQAKRYRFIIINGSNARTYEMFLVNPVTKLMGPVIYQIGTDGGFLDTPVPIDPNAPAGQLQRLVLMPGERADIIIDFAGIPVGTKLLLRNIAKTPYPGGIAASGSTTGRIMQFTVNALPPSPDTSFNPATGGILRPGGLIKRLPGAPDSTGVVTTPISTTNIQLYRQLTLNEVLKVGPYVGPDGVTYPSGPLEILLNNTKWDGKDPAGFPIAGSTQITIGTHTAYYTELPQEGNTEVWDIINLTADAHPIHLHLVQFQLVNRWDFDVKGYMAAYALAFGGLVKNAFGPPYNYGNTNNPDFAVQTNPITVGGNPNVVPFLKDGVKPPQPNERGWKDTVMMLPGQVTRIVVRWAPTDLPVGTIGSFPFNPDGGHGYVWHCHIIDHEDNEMMRPTSVTSNGATRTYNKGIDY